MHWVTSTSFVCHLFCRVDMCRAQFPHPRQHTSLSVSDLISISEFLFIYNMDCQHVFITVLKKYFFYKYYIALSKTWHDLAKLHISILLGLPELGERSKKTEVYRERKKEVSNDSSGLCDSLLFEHFNTAIILQRGYSFVSGLQLSADKWQMLRCRCNKKSRAGHRTQTEPISLSVQQGAGKHIDAAGRI